MSVDFSKIGNSMSDVREFAKGFDPKNSEHKAVGDEFAKSLFKSMDADESGDISKKEFLKATKDTGYTDEFRGEIFEKLSGEDGVIEEKEMTAEDLFFDYGSTKEMDLVEILFEGTQEVNPDLPREISRTKDT